MDQPFPEKNTPKTSPTDRVLVAPLDWGLGHATRCIPIIRELIRQNYDVILAAEGAQQRLLQEEFPGLTILDLPGYRIRYARNKRGLTWKILRQLPKISKAIRKEHQWLENIVSQHKIDLVISDNRYGLYHKNVRCIFMTHQLAVKSPLGKWSEKFLQKRLYRYINRFTECWVPDTETENIAGELSHPDRKPAIPVKYIGLLSRFNANSSSTITPNHLLVILSGPEPQRSILEDKIIREVSTYNGTATIVRGLPGVSQIIPSTGMIRVFNHLSSAELQNEIAKAEYVISRSGYSTVMDMLTMRKKTIMIPTPGQTEQEYLAGHLFKKKMIVAVQQSDFRLSEAVEFAKTFEYKTVEVELASGEWRVGSGI